MLTCYDDEDGGYDAGCVVVVAYEYADGCAPEQEQDQRVTKLAPEPLPKRILRSNFELVGARHLPDGWDGMAGQASGWAGREGRDSLGHSLGRVVG